MPRGLFLPEKEVSHSSAGRTDAMANGTNGPWAELGSSSEGGCHTERFQMHLSSQTVRLKWGKMAENKLQEEGLS